MKTIKVKTQAEFDTAVQKKYDCIDIKLVIEIIKVTAHAGSKVFAYAGSKVYALTGSKVSAYDGSIVFAHAGSIVYACTGSKVFARTSSKVFAYAGSTVFAYDGSTVTAHAGSDIKEYVNNHNFFQYVCNNKKDIFTKNQLKMIDKICVKKICWDEIKKMFGKKALTLFNKLSKAGYDEWEKYYRKIL